MTQPEMQLSAQLKTTPPQHSYLLHPLAPLVFGTGKPMDFGMGGDTLSFPFPSTVAGALRAAYEQAAGRSPDAFATAASALSLQHLSLVSVDLLKPTDVPQQLLPRPADAVYLNGKVLCLVPQAVLLDQYTDLPAGLQALALHGAEGDDLKGKPDEAPEWWTAAQYSAWLANPKGCADYDLSNTLDTQLDVRTHVAIDSGTRGAKTAALFRSAGRDFSPVYSVKAGGQSSTALALAVRCTLPSETPPAVPLVTTLAGGLRRLGGEGRPVRIQSASNIAVPSSPTLSPAATPLTLRFILTTPAIFAVNGWYPDAFNNAADTFTTQLHDTCVTLTAAAIARAQHYSGWVKHEGKIGPGQPHRVVPAGSVFWFTLAEGNQSANFIKALHDKGLCTGAWQTDGWGMGLVGAA